MKLLVLGGSGRSGVELVKQAHARGHQITALVREGSSLPQLDGIRVERGDVLDAATLARVMAGQDAVVSALGLRYSGKSPYSKLVSPPDLLSRNGELLIAAMHSAGIKRLCVMSAAGVGDSAPGLNFMMRFLINTSRIGDAYRDMTRLEDLLEKSDLDWQAVRPTTLTNKPATGQVRAVDHYGLMATIPRADVAAYMLDHIERGELSPRKPLISVT
jgi:putative NADH-flavin reductase